MKKKPGRLAVALLCYAVLIAVALYRLLPVRSSDERFILMIFLLVFAFLIVRTVMHAANDRDS